MLIIFLPSWAAGMLVLLVVLVWVGTWALCRAAALGDEAMFRALESPAQPGVRDEAEPAWGPAPVRLETCRAWEADSPLDPAASDEEELLVGATAP